MPKDEANPAVRDGGGALVDFQVATAADWEEGVVCEHIHGLLMGEQYTKGASQRGCEESCTLFAKNPKNMPEIKGKIPHEEVDDDSFCCQLSVWKGSEGSIEWIDGVSCDWGVGKLVPMSSDKGASVRTSEVR